MDNVSETLYTVNSHPFPLSKMELKDDGLAVNNTIIQ